MTSSPPPNILLIIVHDLGTRLGCCSEIPGISPALHQLAERARASRTTFAQQPFPARAAAPNSPASTPMRAA
jgi:hypothetical protein